MKTTSSVRGTSATLKVDADTFIGLNIDADGSAPSIRHAPPPSGSSYESNRKLKREDQQKVWYDLQRKVCSFVREALNNQIRVPFRVSEFVELRKTKSVPIESPGPLPGLVWPGKRLLAADGPAVVVDLDGVPVFWYFPKFIGKGLHDELLLRVASLTRVYQPDFDTETRDRRAQHDLGDPEPSINAPTHRLTRSQSTKRTALFLREEIESATTDILLESEQGLESEQELASMEKLKAGDSKNGSSLFTSAAPEITPLSGMLRPSAYQETDECVRWATCESENEEPLILPLPPLPEQDSDLRFLSRLNPFAIYLSPGWYQTGMEKIRPMNMSSHFRKCLEPACSAETIAFLESKRLYDRQLRYLTDIIHNHLADSMREVGACMSAVTGPTSVALKNGWTSAFPCFGIGVNRISRIHRDTKGIRGGMDVIGVLGTFTEGGDMHLRDIGLRAEWTPGCLGALDGYDFRHEVEKWAGGSRVALISFCRRSTWTGLGLNPVIARPMVSSIEHLLQSAVEACKKASALLTKIHHDSQRLKGSSRNTKKAKARAMAKGELEQDNKHAEADSTSAITCIENDDEAPQAKRPKYSTPALSKPPVFTRGL